MKLPFEAVGCDVVCGADVLLADDMQTQANSEIFYIYRQTSPYEVTLTLIEPSSKKEIPWSVSRDVLISCALHGISSGSGDFVVEINTKYPLVYMHNDQQTEDTLLMHITGHDPNGGPDFTHLHAFVLREPMVKFLRQTLLVVPAGTESTHYNMDMVLEELLK